MKPPVMIDAGPLIALFDRDEAPHEATRATLSTISDRLFTTGGSLEEPGAPAGGPCQESKPALQATNGSDQGKKWRATVPVLVEAAHLLQPSTPGGRALRDFVLRGAVAVWYLSSATLTRCFALMEQYADQPMDLADASLVVAAERLRTSRIFTLDRKHFSAYRIRRGHRLLPFELV